MTKITYATGMAFPVNYMTWPPDGSIQLGLTKREYFAAKIMQSICSESSFRREESTADLAHYAVVYADALIAELSKVKP